MSSPAKTKKASSLGQLIIPLVALGLLLLFNLIRDPGFYNISVATNNAGNPVLSGNIISIIDSASELAIIAMGMTLVTAACGGQDISVGAVGASATSDSPFAASSPAAFSAVPAVSSGNSPDAAASFSAGASCSGADAASCSGAGVAVSAASCSVVGFVFSCSFVSIVFSVLSKVYI